MSAATKKRGRIEPGDLVQITGINPENVRGLVVEWAASKHGENYWCCIWSNGMSSDCYAADSELRVIAKGREAVR